MQGQDKGLRDYISQDVIEICSVKGLLVKTHVNQENVEYNHAPLSLFSTPFDLKHYQTAKELQSPLGVMVNDLVQQPAQIQEILKYFKEQDSFLKRLLKVSEDFNKLEVKQDLHLCILRSDYMIDKITDSLKLVEYNTIASSFGCLCQKVREVQNYIIKKYADQLGLNYTQAQIKDDGLGSNYIKDMGNVFKRTIEHYISSMKQRHPEIYKDRKIEEFQVLFVIDKAERNIIDQKLIESEIFDSHGILSKRMTFEQVTSFAIVDKKTQSLIIQGHEIAFVYYRTGYQTEQYETENDWKAREILEFSMPIKCPSIDVHLTTFKKFQQAFNDEKLIQTVMIPHQVEANKIQHLFKGIWTLEDIEVQGAELHQIIAKAIENPHNYVIKPQKEGGGNNFYDDEVKELLLKNDKEYLKQFLIMERINPPDVKAYMFRMGKIIEAQTFSELGIFSSVFIDTQKPIENGPIENITFGRLLRTKGSDSNEGGVNAGFAVIDQPLLIEIQDIQKAEILPLIKQL